MVVYIYTIQNYNPLFKKKKLSLISKKKKKKGDKLIFNVLTRRMPKGLDTRRPNADNTVDNGWFINYFFLYILSSHSRLTDCG